MSSRYLPKAERDGNCMKYKDILFLCEDLAYFDKWCNTALNWYNTNNYKKERNKLTISINGIANRYIAYTPKMDKEVLLGFRFDGIIDNIGLSENEKMWFNILIRPEPEFTGEAVFEVGQ